MFSSQSYDGGFGQGAGRESHGEYDYSDTNAFDPPFLHFDIFLQVFCSLWDVGVSLC